MTLEICQIEIPSDIHNRIIHMIRNTQFFPEHASWTPWTLLLSAKLLNPVPMSKYLLYDVSVDGSDFMFWDNFLGQHIFTFKTFTVCVAVSNSNCWILFRITLHHIVLFVSVFLTFAANKMHLHVTYNWCKLLWEFSLRAKRTFFSSYKINQKMSSKIEQWLHFGDVF